MGFRSSAPSPPPLPPVPEPPTDDAEARAAEAMVEELRSAATRKGRRSTILAGEYDVDQPGAIGAKTLLGG